jgi:hypothetical protein
MNGVYRRRRKCPCGELNPATRTSFARSNNTSLFDVFISGVSIINNAGSQLVTVRVVQFTLPVSVLIFANHELQKQNAVTVYAFRSLSLSLAVAFAVRLAEGCKKAPHIPS